MSCSSVEQQCASPHPRNRCCVAQCSSTLLQQLVTGLTGPCQHAVKTMHQLSRKQASKPASKQASEELIHRAPPAPTCSGCTCRPCLSPAAAHSRHAMQLPAARVVAAARQRQLRTQRVPKRHHLLRKTRQYCSYCRRQRTRFCCCCWLSITTSIARAAAAAAG